MKKNSDILNGTDPLSLAFFRAHPDTCAAVTASRGQKLFYFCLVVLLFLLLKYRWDLFIFLTCGVLMLLYASSVLLKGAAAWSCLTGKGVIRIPETERKMLTDLPCYTVLVPLYHEPEVADKILKRLAALDYPKELLDVKILLEADDDVTYSVLKREKLPPWAEVMVVPEACPKTKPRACNFGLEKARGEYCVIYDAEDIPEPDQLKKALAVFRRDRTGKLACVQAKLNYFNARQNHLTRFFTVEYSAYFDLVLGGWNRFGVPLPLGGTSNHFRTDCLRQAGGWDPFNVTEDCDLGIRIYELGFTTSVVDSTTWEEANSRLGNWLRQRSRWVKGFLQTHLAHFRNPLRTVRRLGLKGAFCAYLAVGGSVLTMLTNVIFWPVTIFYLVLLGIGLWNGDGLWEQIAVSNGQADTVTGVRLGALFLSPWALVYTGAGESLFWSVFSWISFVLTVFLLFSNLLLIAVHVLACMGRKFYFLIPWALLMPLYWILISFGAWKGFFQIFTNPFYWEKTLHGLDKSGKK